MDPLATIDRISALISDKAGTEEHSTSSIDLAALQPLSHANPFLSAETFSVENFLISRSHSSLSDFRAELRGYHGVLKEELVKLINDDYAAFISLSTDLRGEGVRIERLKYPLGSLNQELQSSVNQLKQIQETIQQRLDERTALREEKARLHLLLKLSETIVRLESLLFIVKEESSGTLSSRVIRNSDEGFPETRSLSNRVKHVSRTAAEFNQLLYLVDKAKQDKCAFVDEVQWRVDRIKTTLSSDLNHLFSVLLLAHSSLETSNTQDFDPARRKSDIKECLRIYDSIGNWREAEEILRRELVTPFIRESIFPGALTVPHSPLAPRTPFTTRPVSPGPFTPRTPYKAYPLTPWPRKTPIEAYFPSSDFQLPLLNDLENPLASIFNKILRFIERDLKLVLELAETFSERHRQPNMSIKDSYPSNESPGFEIMSNVVWADIGHAILEGLGSTIFAAGRPDDFHENYMTTQRFIEALEVLTPSLHAIKRMRSHPVYISFQKRWQLPVYFQLRWKDIVGDLESALSLPFESRISINDGSVVFLLPQTEACFTAICSCWAEDTYIPEIGHRFWRLTLQINFQTPQSKSDVPIALTDMSNANIAIEDITLSQCGVLASDIKTLERRVIELWSTHISVILSESEEESSSSLVLKQSFKRAVALIPIFGSHVVSILARRCCENLVAVRSVPSQYRALSNQRMPVTPSPFISDVLKPMRSFFLTTNNTLKDDPGPQWIAEIFHAVCTRYVSHLVFTKKTEESLRRLKRGKVSAFPLFGSSKSSSQDIDGKEEERVRAQMILDVTALGNEARELGVDISQDSYFQELKAMASAVGKSSRIVDNIHDLTLILKISPHNCLIILAGCNIIVNYLDALDICLNHPLSRMAATSELAISPSFSTELRARYPSALVTSAKSQIFEEAVLNAFNPPAAINATPSPTSARITLDSLNLIGQPIKHVQTRENHPSSGLAFLAAVCASSSMRWDPLEKHHYLDCVDNSESLEAGLPISDDLEECEDSKESISNIHAAHEVDIQRYSQNGRDEALSNYNDNDVFLSPASHLMSSPTSTHVDFISTPPNSSTIAASSPIKTADDLFDSAFSDEFHEIPPMATQPTPIYIDSRGSRARISNPAIKSYAVVSDSPLRAPNPVFLANDMGSSPLSSLMSSPLNLTFDDELRFHCDISSSVLSSRSVTPDLDASDEISEVGSFPKARRASTNDAPTSPRSEYKNQRFDTAPPESVPKKRRRGSSPSSPTLHLNRLQNRHNSSSRLTMGKEAARTGRLATGQVSSMLKTKTKTKAKAKVFQKHNIVLNKENVPNESSSHGTTTSHDDLAALPMTGFLVETLALSRASAIIAPELLQNVLKSQPHLREERSEEAWLAIVKEILNGVRMFGRIEKNGLGAADHHLEDEWFYIPENDEEPDRADLLKGLMPKKRAVTKQAKQYYFEPMAKLTRWDPEED